MRTFFAAAATLLAAPAAAQIAPETKTVVRQVAPPATAITEIAPGTFLVTPVPGVEAATRVKVQKFGDYDLNKDGAYNAMEFAQAAYFLATSDPVAGNPKLPAWDRYTHPGAWQQMHPRHAIALLDATSDEFLAADLNNDWRVTPEELLRASM